MKDDEKKVNEAEEEVQTEEEGVQLTEEELAQVSGGGLVHDEVHGKLINILGF